MQVINKQEWQTLPEKAQQEVYDFFLFIKQRYAKDVLQSQTDTSETVAYSNHSANLVKDWLNVKEDNVWK